MQNLLDNQVSEFIDYVCSFYEEGNGLYAKDFTPPVSRKEIVATTLYTIKMSELGHLPEFEFDSIDREMVRLQLDRIREPRPL